MNTTNNILSRIASYKRQEVAAAKEERPLRVEIRCAEEAPPPRGFRAALDAAKDAKRPGLIAEIKRRAPLKASYARILIRPSLGAPMSAAVQAAFPC